MPSNPVELSGGTHESSLPGVGDIGQTAFNCVGQIVFATPDERAVFSVS